MFCLFLLVAIQLLFTLPWFYPSMYKNFKKHLMMDLNTFVLNRTANSVNAWIIHQISQEVVGGSYKAKMQLSFYVG